MDVKALRNTARNALRPGYLPVMASKLKTRVTERGDRRAATEWAANRVEDFATFGRAHSAELFDEATEFADRLAIEAPAKLRTLGVGMGGGGHYQLTYFLVRLRRPTTVVETGVAAGWTSEAILAALEVNGHGTLWSSDFPYFRLEDPERYVGVLVEERLKHRWHLGTQGDAKNLAEFLPQIDSIDLVHYDSDKSVSGRTRTMDLLAAKLAEDSVVVMDDIQDNTFFRDWVTRDGVSARVFGFGGKYVGLTGL